jgi:hypothetical protein
MTAGLCQQFLYLEGLLQAASIKTERNQCFDQNDIKRNIPYGINYYYSKPTCNKPLMAVQINQPTRCNNFSSLLLDVYVRLNMFRVSPRPSSGAQQLPASPTTTNRTDITTLQR